MTPDPAAVAALAAAMDGDEAIDDAYLEARRKARLSGPTASLTAHHFDEQRAFYAPRKRSLRAALCSRRAGKTRGGNESDLEIARRTKHGRFLYVNETRGEAKRLAWYGARGDGMFSMCRDLGWFDDGTARYNETELWIHFPAMDSWIFLIGVDDEAAVKRALGLPWHRVRWDEAQRIPAKLTQTILETLLVTILDYQGEMLFTGTPERKMGGIFYEITKQGRDAKWNAWDVHRWTLNANPYWGRAKQIDDQWFVVWGADDEIVSGPHAPAALLAAVLAARHLTGVLGLQELLGGPEVAPLDSPIMRRQAFGEWVREDSNYVYAVNKLTDAELFYAPHRARPDGFVDVARALLDLPYDFREGFFAMGADLGYNDPFSFSLRSWHPSDANLYEVCAWKKSGLTSDEQNAALQDVRQHVAVGTIVADAGGIGKQVVKGWSKEWVERYGLPIEEAEKQHKQTAQNVYNADVMARRTKYREGSPLIEEMRELQWATIVDGSGRMVEDPTIANDLCDADLYCHRRAYHFRHRPEEQPPPPGSPAAYARQAAELEAEYDQEDDSRDAYQRYMRR